MSHGAEPPLLGIKRNHNIHNNAPSATCAAPAPRQEDPEPVKRQRPDEDQASRAAPAAKPGTFASAAFYPKQRTQRADGCRSGSNDATGRITVQGPAHVPCGANGASSERLPAGAPPRGEFALQQQAFTFVDAQGPWAQHLRVFGREFSADGKRRFIACTPAALWNDDYAALPPADRHFYEIIRQGAPCQLYFDLEYQPQYNPGLDGNALVAALVGLVKEELSALFRIQVPDAWIYELDSSSSAKFSRHVIVALRRCAFKDNGHVGAFVRRLSERVRDEQQQPQQQQQQQRFPCFQVRRSYDPAVALTSFIDASVYSRNRAFRLYGSSKVGKGVVLRATNRYATGLLASRCGSGGHPNHATTRPPPPLQQQQQQQHHDHHPRELGPAPQTADAVLLVPSDEQHIGRDVFFSTLCTSVGKVDRLLEVPGAGCAGALAPRLPGQWPAPTEARPEGALQLSGGAAAAAAAVGLGSSGPQYGPCPFPQVAAFIERVCGQEPGAGQGHVRSWVYSEAAGNLLLNIKDNRWCANIGASHKSNGVYYVVEFASGTWHQRCYDPDCRHYRSPLMPLPHEAWQECREHHHRKRADTTNAAAASPAVAAAAASAPPAGGAAEAGAPPPKAGPPPPAG